MLSQAAAAGIEEFARKGGVVVAEARTAWNDETGYCGEAVPGLGLERVFGCQGWPIFVGTLLSFGFYKFKDENVGKLLKGLTRPDRALRPLPGC